MSALFNLARFDLVSIRLVVDCVQHGSLSAAARASHLALAAASRRIRDLEDAVREPLFERHGRGLRPTPAGRVFARHGLGLLQGMEQLAGELSDLRQGIARRIRLSANSAAINEFLPPLLARYARQARQVRIELEEQLSTGVVMALREGRADVGVFAEGPDTEGLQCRVFRHDQLVLVLPQGHSLAGRGALPFADALDEDWITLSDGAAVVLRQQQAALAAGRPLRIRMQVRSFDAVCHLVSSGLGIAVLPRNAVRPLLAPMKLRVRPLSDEWASRDLLVATRAGAVEPAVGELVDFLASPGAEARAKKV
ncbi:LysR family transcriptional regulator [Ramlibacter sp. AW1]|uniref:LysR family transcriptional regulator n=1 Tax=Ramlibacter aurantiacus TaxID=2801330 RepID=A0A936ZN24_9BURK|nr:LysR substrate-binding domain-containing protein [Ramlibacter aurantiacus]MBL0423193.1 LysR family transcriptional regulator [Ramlibacter aurantiacus]